MSTDDDKNRTEVNANSNNSVKLYRVAPNGTAVLVDTDEGPVLMHVTSSLDAYELHNYAGAQLLRALLADPTTWVGLISSWEHARPCLAEMAELFSERGRDTGGWASQPLSSAHVLAPVVSPTTKIFAIGANFADHLARVQTTLLGRPVSEEEAVATQEGPWGFTVLHDSIVGDRDYVIPPRGTKRLDYEAEFALVLESGGRDLAPEDVRFWGISAFNDFSIRDPHLGFGPVVDRGPLVWSLQKNFHTGKSLGPCIATADDIDVANLTFGCRVNGEARQEGCARDVIQPLAKVAAHLSHYVKLRPGDTIVSGTPMGTALEEGTDGPFLQPGDVIHTWAEGVGVLTNVIGSWDDR